MPLSSSERRDKPRAIPILKFSGNSIELDQDAVTSIFRNPKIQDKPLCIVSMSGAFRKGKSFMLNFFIRYLRNMARNNSDWMGRDDDPLNEGLEWRGGRDACTKGILIWNEVFISKKNGEEVTILLMDTQGLYDNDTDSKTNSIIFALSTLISSVQIFNLSQHIQESDLGFLQFFTAYANAAREEDSSPDGKPFQSLVFLVRDWQNDEELEYGMKGGEKYLAEVLKHRSTSEELSSVRRFLTSSFESTKCCLLPHPGLKVATSSKAFTGCLRDIEQDFVSHTVKFVDSLFQPINLVVKTINGQVVSAVAMMQYIVDCAASFKDGKLPVPKTMMENIAEAQNLEAQRQCGEEYRQKMNEELKNSFVDESYFSILHELESMRALRKFADKTRFGTEESRRKHRDYLKFAIHRDYRTLTQVNHSKKVEAEVRMSEVIEGIAGDYEKKLKESTEERQFLSELELQKNHTTFEFEALKKYSDFGDVNPQLQDKYLQQLQSMIEKIEESVRSENEEKRRIAEEKDETGKKLMKRQLECAIEYRKPMRQRVEHYTEETELSHLDEQERKRVVGHFEDDLFDISAFDFGSLDISLTYRRKTRSDYVDPVKSKLNEEFRRIEELNEEKKVNLEEYLELQKTKSIVKYEDTFRIFLNDKYVEKDVLKQKHDEVVQALTGAMSLSFGADTRRIPIVALHLERVKNTLSSKYFTIEEWNEKNNAFFRKCFKAAQRPVINIVGGTMDLLGKMFS